MRDANTIEKVVNRADFEPISLAFHLSTKSAAIQINLLELFIQMIETWKEQYDQGIRTQYTEFAHRNIGVINGRS